MKRKDRIIVALDVTNIEAGRDLVAKLYPLLKVFKVGSQLFTERGGEAVSMVKRKGADCFLDLKYHDIPETVGNAAVAATKLGADMFDVHASGGFEMMKKAVSSSCEIAEKLKLKKPIILGITVLTSMNKQDLAALGIERTPAEQALFLAGQAKKAGLDGVVASSEEIEIIKKELGKDFLVVVPGIRPEWSQRADQKRVATPKEAFDRGADYIVIGRPITEAHDPKEAAEKIVAELE